MVVWGFPHVRVGHRQTIKYEKRPIVQMGRFFLLIACHFILLFI